jgi:prepilin-type N-terminal cleavage/methylation domain-containing protein
MRRFVDGPQSKILKEGGIEMLKRFRNREQGFTLIELLIVVAIIGIIAAILIPNLIDALQKAKQKRTMADMRNVGTSWASWVTDQVSAAAAGSTNTWDSSDYGTTLTASDLYQTLHPSTTFFYINEVPQKDGWKNDYWYGYSGNPLASQVIAIASGGRDGSAVPQSSYVIGPFIPTAYDNDIVWADGFFIRWPSGAQTN